MKFTTQNTLILVCLLFTTSSIFAQTKRIKRPSSRIGVYSADTFVRESFDIYDKTYRYDGYQKAGTPLSDDDVDVLESALTDAERLLESAPNVVSDLDGMGAFKQAKATLQLNRAKKALRYCIETIPELLKGRKNGDDDTGQQDDGSSNDDTSGQTDGGGGNNGNTEGQNDDNDNNDGGNADAGQNDPVVINSKFDFVPGNELIFFDDFSGDYIGDFPAKWNTNGSGEVVTFGSDPQKWFQLKNGHHTYFVPDVDDLPEEYTIELDVKTVGLTRQTSSAARFTVIIAGDNKLQNSINSVLVAMNYPQYIASSFRVTSNLSSGDNINNVLNEDVREEQLEVHHISIAVNKRRLRYWVNQQKCVDVPRIIPESAIFNSIKLNIVGFKDDTERLFVSNVRIAKGGLDLRGTLLSEGTVSTSGILFDSGSASIKGQSYGIIRQISQVLLQDTAMNLLIVGYTDSDGPDASNIALSKARAAAVKQALVNNYGIAESRLSTDGKGEADPVAGNDSPEGKAANRRVVFTRQ